MIPGIFHFSFVTKNSTPFCFFHYLCLRSCFETQSPEKIIVWVDTAPESSLWWDKALEFIEIRSCQDPDETTKRIAIISEHGGVYCDLDFFFLRSCATLLEKEEIVIGVDRGFIAATPGHGFLQRWQNKLSEVDPLTALIEESPELAQHLVELRACVDIPDIGPYLFHAFNRIDDTGYYVDLTQEVNWETLKRLTPEFVLETNTTFNYVARGLVEPPDLSQLTLIIPVHIDGPNRLENVSAVIYYLVRHLYVKNIILVEIDTVPKLATVFNQYSEVRYMFVQRGSDEPWSRSRPFNCALPWVDTDYVSIWDADMISSLPRLLTGYKTLVDGTADYVIPYDTVYHVTRPIIETMYRGRVNEAILKDHKRVLAAFGNTAGGVGLMRTSFIRHIRGMNELFHGWGFEDDEFIVRVQKLGARVVRVGGPLIHISHSRGSTSLPMQGYSVLSKAERQRMFNWDAAQIRDYIGVTEHVGKYSTLRVPEPPDDALLEQVRKLYEPNTVPDPLFDSPHARQG